MGIFDNYNYEINRRLPEFWKDDSFLKPIERISALIMRDTVQRFMEKMGVMQPFMLWKTLPEEYDWEYGFEDYDMRLASNEENPNCNQTLMISDTNHIVAQLPLTKRDVNAYIVIDLSSMSFSDSTEYTKIQELTIKNADQILKIKDIDSKTVIEIYTDSNTILINDLPPKAEQIEGHIDIIKREPREAIETITDPLDINEKCELEIYTSGEIAYCDLYIKLYYPVYVTEQNIRIFTLSAFPLEYVRLYGYMCHKYNNNHQWVYLWEKVYGYEDRIVYDKIAKQYDCEIFYAEIKLYGLPAPIYVGFPASYADSTDGIFSLNESLDYWGRILHIPRRQYKTDILETEERYCFPKYYAYSVEQDYPYEQRLINEYKYNEDWEDYINIVDVEGTDIALVRCKDPYIENIYMYTETIPPTDILNSKTTFTPTCITQIDKNNEDTKRSEWTNENNLRYESNSYSIITLNNKDEEHITDKSYQANVLSMEFDLTSLPENCKIKGMQLKFKGVSNTHSDNIYIDDRSFLKYTQKVKNDETGNHYWQSKEIPLTSFFDMWSPDNASYVLGYEDSIFFENGYIDRDSIEKGYLRDGLYQENKIRFDIGFSNTSPYLDLIIKLFNIQLIIYFDLIKEDIDTSISIPNKTIIYDNISQQASCINLNLNFKNVGEIKETDYNAFVIIPSELCFVDYENESYILNPYDSIKQFKLGNFIEAEQSNVLYINEKWKNNILLTARNTNLLDDNPSNDNVPAFKAGRYDILLVCGEDIITEEVYIYDKQFAENNNLISNAIYDEEDIILTFGDDYQDAQDGEAVLNLQLKTLNNQPIPYQSVSIKRDDTNETSYYILDENGELSIPIYTPINVLFIASYGNIKAKHTIYSFSIKFDIFKYFNKKYDILYTDDLHMLRWVLLKNIPNNTEDIINALKHNEDVSSLLEANVSLIEQGYSTNFYHDCINRHDDYVLIFTANVTRTDKEKQQKDEEPRTINGILTFGDINKNITNNGPFEEDIEVHVTKRIPIIDGGISYVQ